jgi:O-glycosyl hydrolase
MKVRTNKYLNMKRKNLLIFLILLFFTGTSNLAQYPVFRGCPVTVEFSKPLRDWDGFGFNYVETAQTIDYNVDAKDYGGFSIMTEQTKREIIDLIFGEDGLKPGLIKMFLDPFHQNSPQEKFNHERSTSSMRMFVRMGLETTRLRGSDLQIITTLYGPPGYMTLQKVMRGRDLDPAHKIDLANYMIDWAKFLKEKEKLPIKYISLHNEGEDWERWPWDGKEGNIGKGHDYNMFWPPSQVADFLSFMQPMLNKAGLSDVKVTNGEPTNWYRFSFWGFPEEIAAQGKALNNLGIITSHGFYVGGYDNRWYGSHTNKGISYLRSLRPELHAWVTSTSWSKMDSKFIKEIWGNIYEAQVNGIIPWAGIQRPPLWVGGDPNPGCAIKVSEDGGYEIQPGYYFYKQVSRAGQPGMKVASTMSMDSELPVIAFSSNGTNNKNAFVIANTSAKEKPVEVTVKGNNSHKFKAFRTNGEEEKYNYLGEIGAVDGKILYAAPPNSVTTFFSID